MFAVLHLADFALHAVLRTEPALAGQPAALFAGSGKKSVVLAANPAARVSGVELGMNAPQAVARCPGLVIRAPQPAAEAEALAALLAVGFTLSPLIEATAPGVCTIDLKGSEAIACPELSRKAVAELARLGLPATGGIARTPLLALYAARAAHDRTLDRDQSSLADSALLPKSNTIASKRPSRIEAVLVVTDAASFLAPLPLATADPSPALAGVLANWGLRTLGDLTAISRDEIVHRFGAEGLALWQRAAGGDTRPLRPVIPPQAFSAAMEFEHPIETLEPLLFILRRFLDRLSLELIASQHVAAGIELTLCLEDGTRHARSFRLPEPTAAAEILFRALHTHLDSLHTAASIAAIDLGLIPARPLVRQQGLFDTSLRDPHGFAETLARISALVGANRIGTPQLEETHRPDAVRLTPPATVIPPLAPAAVHPPLSTPLRRFRPPLPARVEFTGTQPSYLWTERLHGEIAFHSAPIRSNGDWWQRDRAWTRTEWDVALAGGGLYRLLLVDQAYFIEGEYD